MQGYSPADELIEAAEDMLAVASQLSSLGEELRLRATGIRQRAARQRAERRKASPLKLVAQS